MLLLPTFFFSFNLNIVWYFVAVGKLLVFVVTPTNPLTLSRTRECVFDPCTWRSISMDENYFMLFGNLSDLLLCYFSMVHGVPATFVNIGHLVPYEMVARTHGDFEYMMASSNENILRVTGHLCGEFTGHR